ncbi:hypothetical protein H5410_063739 [Solanum commersonii]|uniref:Uncharacterized protein n=1 Tax=Solanum commersonii TaxID=4109 RepID=A0A9J5WER1_SOLCO|nr:hypothetical protein H5410_063739 [Solanum commersonii]
MAMGRGFNQETRTGAFFMATLLIWVFSVLWEILINKRKELFLNRYGFHFLPIGQLGHPQIVAKS